MKTIPIRHYAWLLMMLFACSKDKTSTQVLTRYSFPAEAVAYLMIPVTHYYVYRDAMSGGLYTVVVKTCKIEEIHQAAHTVWQGSPLFGKEVAIPAYEYEKFTLALENRADGTSWLDGSSHDMWYNSGPTTAGSLTVTVGASILLKNSTAWDATIFYYPVRDFCTYIGNLQVEGTTYPDVLKVSIWDNSFWWAKGYGIVRMDRNGTVVKTLVAKRSL